MNRLWKIGVLGGAFALVAAFLASGVVTLRVGSGDHALAASGATPAASTQPKVVPTLVAVAIGKLQETSGGGPTVDLRAAIRGTKTGGDLRFFDNDLGYYNGGVHTLSVDATTIKVTGGGGLVRPDGTRVGVRYSAQFALDGSSATITVQGRNLQYTMTGRFDGFVHVFHP